MSDFLNADAIMSAVESGNDPSQLGAGGAVQETAPATQETAKPAETAVEQAAEQFRKEMVVNGQKIEVTDPSKYDQWAQQGYSYSQNMASLNEQKAELERQRQETEQRLNAYKDVDTYARENPEWWNHVEERWQGRQLHKMAPEVQEAIKPFMSEFVEMKNFMNEFQKEKIETEARSQDEALQNQIVDLGKQFPEVNFGAVDANGQSLELQILNHAANNGIPTFRAAFYDYYQGNLQKLYETRGRSAVEKDLAERKKAGILSTSQVPAKSPQIQPLQNSRKKTWADVAKEAARDLGLG